MPMTKWKYLPNNSNVRLEINDLTELIKILKLQYEKEIEEMEEKNKSKIEQVKSSLDPLTEYSPGQYEICYFKKISICHNHDS